MAKDTTEVLDENCPICRLMEKADKENRELTYEELMQGFAEASLITEHAGFGEDL